MKLRRFVLAMLAASLVAGCGSASDNITFHAPASYHALASLGPFVQMWEGKPNNMIILMSFPVAMDLDKSMSQANLKDAKVEKHENLTICNGQHAMYAEVRGETATTSSKQTGPSEIQFIATNAKGKTYMAMYSRPVGVAPDPEASGAIRNLCPK